MVACWRVALWAVQDGFDFNHLPFSVCCLTLLHKSCYINKVKLQFKFKVKSF